MKNVKEEMKKIGEKIDAILENVNYYKEQLDKVNAEIKPITEQIDQYKKQIALKGKDIEAIIKSDSQIALYNQLVIHRSNIISNPKNEHMLTLINVSNDITELEKLSKIKSFAALQGLNKEYSKKSELLKIFLVRKEEDKKYFTRRIEELKKQVEELRDEKAILKGHYITR